MKKYVVSFITLFCALSTMPCFALPGFGCPGDTIIKKIKEDISINLADYKPLDKGHSISFEDCSWQDDVAKAIDEWLKKCDELKPDTEKTHIVRFGSKKEIVAPRNYVVNQILDGQFDRIKLTCDVKECSKGYVVSHNALNQTVCVPSEETKLEETLEKIKKCEKDKNGRWDNITKSCWCGAKKQSLEYGAEKCIKKSETEKEPKQKTGICTNAKEHHALAKYVDGVCTVQSCVVGYELSDNTCVKKTTDTEPKQKTGICTNAKEHHALAKYVDGVCTVQSCVTGYDVSEDKLSCVKKTDTGTSTKTQKNAEKSYLKDVDELIDAYKTVTNKIITKCRAEGGKATDTGCEK